MMLRSLLLAAAALPVAGAALAQSDPMATARLANANQAGMMQYCLGHGWVDQASVDAQQRNGASLPPATDKAGLDAAEASGKAGNIMGPSGPTALSKMAAQTNTTEQALCGKFGDSAKMAATQRAAMPAMPAMSTMPAMPGGMPAMPRGMPSVPGMPTMPQAPR